MWKRLRGTPISSLITALLMAIFGIYLFAGGVWLAAIGGSPYYLVAGFALATTAGLVFVRRIEALWLHAFLLLGTLVWAVWEVGFDFWSLAPRGDILLPIAIWLLILFAMGSFVSPRRSAPAAALGLATAASLVVLTISLTRDPHDLAGDLDMAAAAPLVAPASAGADWTAYGGGAYGDRYSSLNQITPGNIGKLKLVWEFRTGDQKTEKDPVEYTNESTPLKIGDLLYTCSPHQIVFALDARTGTLRWKFDPQVQGDPTFQHMTCRGVAYHLTAPGAQTADGQRAPSECRGRIFLPTDDGRMFALDSLTGKPCDGFGDHGAIDLKQSSAVQRLGFYEGTSPPAVTDKVLIVGGAVIDNYSNQVPAGVIRGFDIYSGKLLWAFDAGAADPNQLPSDSGHDFTAGSPNSWSVTSVDEKLGLAYVPLGSSSPDIWGGLRTPEQERYDSALVALDIATGKLRWSFQNVHHDLWDMDMPSQPSLVDVTAPGGMRQEVLAPAKTGDIFVLDRRNGQSIVPAPETPAPQSDVAPGDHVAPTQPHSQLSFRPRRPLRGRDMWGATMFDQLACRIMFHRLRYDGPFTPPSLQGTLVFPGDFGMFEWGGIAVDGSRQIAIANPMSMAFVSRLIPRGPDNPSTPDAAHPPGSEIGVQPMYGAPYGVTLEPFLSPIHVPCLAPPWGQIAGIDLKTNKVVWKHRVGTIRDETPVPLPFRLGVPMLGGPMVTAGGVAFLTGTADDYIRAFDVSTGALLWRDRLPAGGQSTPMSYEIDGRQYIVTVDGGHGSFGATLGDYVRAYTLSP